MTMERMRRHGPFWLQKTLSPSLSVLENLTFKLLLKAYLGNFHNFEQWTVTKQVSSLPTYH